MKVTLLKSEAASAVVGKKFSFVELLVEREMGTATARVCARFVRSGNLKTLSRGIEVCIRGRIHRFVAIRCVACVRRSGVRQRFSLWSPLCEQNSS